MKKNSICKIIVSGLLAAVPLMGKMCIRDRGNIEQITDTELRIRLRATQRNASVFSPDSRYAVGFA